jgi:hypothetical protein
MRASCKEVEPRTLHHLGRPSRLVRAEEDDGAEDTLKCLHYAADPHRLGSREGSSGGACRARSVHVVVLSLFHRKARRDDPNLWSVRLGTAIGIDRILSTSALPSKAGAMARHRSRSLAGLPGSDQ